MSDKRLARDAMKNLLEGKAKRMKGRVEDAVGGLTGDSRLQVKGKVDQAKGKIQETIGKVEKRINRRP